MCGEDADQGSTQTGGSPILDRDDLPGFVTGMHHAAFTVPDLESAIDFYQKAFDMRVAFRRGPIDSREVSAGYDYTAARLNVPDARYRLAMLEFLDGSRLELFQYERPESTRDRPPRNSDLGGHHVAVTVRGLESVRARLTALGCTPQEGPTVLAEGQEPHARWPAMRCNYILDPWGNQLELVERP